VDIFGRKNRERTIDGIGMIEIFADYEPRND